ncbi:QORL1 protein, partial [Pomatorhinus ruficollis]|nr:QORL1 protein [Pomatorhinus ruficollis]
MKALYGQQNSPGEEMTFVFQERENLPATRDHEVKVQVRACALSWVDTKLLSEIKLKKELVPVGREISGVVLEVGSKVTFFQPDDEVVGIFLVFLPSLLCVCWCVCLCLSPSVHKPEKVCWAEAAGTVRDGLRAYTALHYLSQVSPGSSVLVLDGASPFGTIAIQLARHRGAKVICTAHSLEDKQHLERLRPAGGEFYPSVLKLVLKNLRGIYSPSPVRLYSAEDEPASKPQLLPHKHDIITLLGVGGHWITTEKDLQLDPPDSHSLFLKGATVSFLNDEIWNLSNVQQGKYLDILCLSCAISVGPCAHQRFLLFHFRPQLDEPIPLYEAKVSMEIVQKNQARKRQVIQF